MMVTFAHVKTEEYRVCNSSSPCLAKADKTTIPVALSRQILLS